MNSTIIAQIMGLVSFFLNNGFRPKAVKIIADPSKDSNHCVNLGYVKPSYNERLLTIVVNVGSQTKAEVEETFTTVCKDISALRGGDFRGAGWEFNQTPVLTHQEYI